MNFYVKNQGTPHESTMKTTGINPSIKNLINHANKEIAQMADDDEELNVYEGYLGIFECPGTLPEELRSLQENDDYQERAAVVDEALTKYKFKGKMLTKNIEETNEEIYMKKLTEVNAQFEDIWIQHDETTKNALKHQKKN